MKVAIFWHRRDLRIQDNRGLEAALRSGLRVQPVFIFDRDILDKLEKNDRRVSFIHHYLKQINLSYQKHGSHLDVRYGYVEQVWEQILLEYEVQAVFTNRDYEPYATQRDQKISDLLQKRGIGFQSFKDQCIFENLEVAKDDGLPYTVFTPYSRKWLSKLNPAQSDQYFKPYQTEPHLHRLSLGEPKAIIELKAIGFEENFSHLPPAEPSLEIVRHYAEKRNFPAQESTTRIGVHLRFGTISIREMVRIGLELSPVWLNELIWRDFYMMILANFPHVVAQNFNRRYDKVVWRNSEAEYEAWCEGRTGYPLVDAGMRELNQTGFMHNRVRMVTASFLTKHLLIDWRWGEAYFAQKLIDFELSSNNGGWQWAASTGTDAQPYFRVFNPTEQAKKFDPQAQYIKKWVPEWQGLDYPQPIVEHSFARVRALETFKAALE
jgi:deoxyribodipyrimidine photo-lyase